MSRIGDIEFECFRSPKKEARILDLVSGHKNFMHGYSIQDEKGNLIRILDFIKGKTLAVEGKRAFMINRFSPWVLLNFSRYAAPWTPSPSRCIEINLVSGPKRSFK